MNNKKDIIIKIILIIIIIILLIHNCNMLRILKDNDNNKTPTGNVDIFEINCNKDTCDDVNNNNSKTDITSTTTTTNNNNNNTVSTAKTDEDNNKEFTIEDDYITWKSSNTLNIFSNPVYNMDSKIAPGDTNIYQFVVKNNTKYNIKYNIKFIENNNYGINIKYRLKKGNTYIAGNDDYVDYNSLNQNNININKDKSTTYYLEWKWIDSDNDNSLAGIEDAYKLSIEIEAESINE